MIYPKIPKTMFLVLFEFYALLKGERWSEGFVDFLEACTFNAVPFPYPIAQAFSFQTNQISQIRILKAYSNHTQNIFFAAPGTPAGLPKLCFEYGLSMF